MLARAVGHRRRARRRGGVASLSRQAVDPAVRQRRVLQARRGNAADRGLRRSPGAQPPGHTVVASRCRDGAVPRPSHGGGLVAPLWSRWSPRALATPSVLHELLVIWFYPR